MYGSKVPYSWVLVLAAGLLVFAGQPVHAAACAGQGVEVQVLGSGGPELHDRRASSSYLVWRDGRARVLVDSGGGSALRFGQSGARVADLDLVLFTHLHVDHAADFPALVKSSFFEDRDRPLPVLGPGGNRLFPPLPEFVRALLGAEAGAFRYLGDFLVPGQASYVLQPSAIEPPAAELRVGYDAGGIVASAASVVHGTVPALAWRVELDGVRIAFSGDGNGEGTGLEKVAANADLFVAHNAVPEGAEGVARRLHMPPSVIGRIAQAAAVKRLVLSHRMLRTLGREAESRAMVSTHYRGPVEFADDLDCYRVVGAAGSGQPDRDG